MINYEDIKKAQDYIVEQWGEDGKKVVTACYYSRKGVMSNKDFLDNCTACGGNWGRDAFIWYQAPLPYCLGCYTR